MKDDAGDDDPVPVRAIERLRGITLQLDGDTP
jgi:hypothetical protein